jgi:hypothetical protein
MLQSSSVILCERIADKVHSMVSASAKPKNGSSLDRTKDSRSWAITVVI